MSYVEFRDVKKVYKTGEVEINAVECEPYLTADHQLMLL